MLSPGSTDYTTSFKPVINSDWILMPLYRLAKFDEKITFSWLYFNPLAFLVRWALTVSPGAHLGAEYLWQIGLSAIPPHSFPTHCSTCRLDMYKLLQMPPLCEKDLSWKRQYMVLHCKKFPFCLPVMAKYLTSHTFIPLSPHLSSLQNQSYNDLQLQRILSLSYNSIFPSRRDEKTPSRMNGIFSLSRGNALLTKWSVLHQNIWELQKLTHMRLCY